MILKRIIDENGNEIYIKISFDDALKEEKSVLVFSSEEEEEEYDEALEEEEEDLPVPDVEANEELDESLVFSEDIEDVEDDGEPFDEKMKRLTSELSGMFKKSHELEEEIKKNLKAIGYDI